MRPWMVVDVAGDGAAKQLQWGHGLAAVDGSPAAMMTCRRTSFNGATALRPWMGIRDTTNVREIGLQWGHGLAAVVGFANGAGCPVATQASMGPRPCGRGWAPRPLP